MGTSLQLPLFNVKSSWRPPDLSILPSWKGAKRIGIDIETYDPNLKATGPSVRTGGYICGVSFALEGDVYPDSYHDMDKRGLPRAFYLPIRHFGGDNVPIAGALFYLRSQAKQFTGEIVGANFQYDLDYLAEEQVCFPQVKAIRDIQIADPLLYELHNSYTLEAIAQRWGYEGKSEKMLEIAAREFGINPKADMWKLPARYVGAYAEDDARLAVEIIAKQEAQLKQEGLWNLYEIESRLQPVLLKSRRQGILIDQDKLSVVEDTMLGCERDDCAEIQRRTGVKMVVGDCNKKKITSAVLTEIGVRFKHTATGQPKIDKYLLESIDHPVADLLQHARKVNKIRTTFCKSIRNHMVNGRIHATANQMVHTRKGGDAAGPKYGRISLSNPNLQNQPARDPEFAKLWRSIYIPDEGMTWMSADYSQQEPRMLVHFAELVGLRGAHDAAERFRNDPKTDNHAMMTRLIHPELAHLDDEHDDFQAARKPCKNIFLGLCYGMGGGKLAIDLGLPAETKKRRNGSSYQVAGPEAQRLLDRFDRAVPYVRKLAKKCEERANQRGYVTTILGRHCRFPIDADGKYDWTYCALNRVIQGSAADQVKKAMVEIDAAGLPIQLQVHDELCSSVTGREMAEEYAKIMVDCVQLRVPSSVDIELGPSWGEAK